MLCFNEIVELGLREEHEDRLLVETANSCPKNSQSKVETLTQQVGGQRPEDYLKRLEDQQQKFENQQKTYDAKLHNILNLLLVGTMMLSLRGSDMEQGLPGHGNRAEKRNVDPRMREHYQENQFGLKLGSITGTGETEDQKSNRRKDKFKFERSYTLRVL